MSDILLIYLAGWLCSFVALAVGIYKEYKRNQYLESDDIFVMIFIPLLSWVAVLLTIVAYCYDINGTIIYDKRKTSKNKKP